MLLSGLIAGGTDGKVGRQARYMSAALPQESKAVPDRRSWGHSSFFYFHQEWRTGTNYDFVGSKHEMMGLKFNPTFSNAVVHVGAHSGRMRGGKPEWRTQFRRLATV